eukprot:TRINITY_DN102279_c0_g1_i1.p1 TRINITY_DN102279_c0_g1~~TRINITY_DN102279_c0_g1_i1.p1  ORF type:complete len:357 (+),score=82.05 TRINITY_DN102279_c0_g1_i1:103-1173(+)
MLPATLARRSAGVCRQLAAASAAKTLRRPALVASQRSFADKVSGTDVGNMYVRLARQPKEEGGDAAPTPPTEDRHIFDCGPPSVAAVPDVAHFHSRPRKSDKTVAEKLDLDHLFTSPVYSLEERADVAVTHKKPRGFVEKLAYGAVQTLRFGADLFSGYTFKSSIKGGMSERDWLRRIVFLETVAGVPGMVGGMVRHLHSLRLMKRDNGWIHALLSEAENERMHLLIALKLYRPGKIFRFCVLVGQGIFFNFFFIAYMLSPRFCHRFVGYLEEEAVKTYTHLLEEMDADMLPLFADAPAPMFARTYYHLPADAKLREVFACMRKDEAHHRDSNHTFSRLKPDEPNPMVEHLRQYHH